MRVVLASLLWLFTLVKARECDSVIGSFTAEQVKVLGRRFVAPLVQEKFLNSTSRALFLTAKYDVLVMKFCTTCRDTDKWIIKTGLRVPQRYVELCDIQDYTFDQIQSSLVFLPIDPESGKVFNETNLRLFLNYGNTGVNVDETPTVEFPSSLDQIIGNVAQPKDLTSSNRDLMVKYLPAMVAASSGSIGLMPDYFGYGESSSMSRTNFQTTSIEQNAIIQFLKLKSYFEGKEGCTRLDDAVTIRGVEHGAMAGFFASDILRQFGVRTLTNFASTGVLNTEVLLSDILEAARSNQTFPSAYNQILPLMAHSFSADLPNMPNTGSGERLVSSIYSGVVSALSPPTKPIAQLLPQETADIVDPTFRSHYDNNIDDVLPCEDFLTGNSNGQFENLCRAISSASAWEFMGQGDRPAIFPFNLCFSDEDLVYSTGQFPQRLWDNSVTTFGSRYNGPIGFEELAPTGNHLLAKQLCTLAPIFFFNLQGHVPVELEDRPNYQAPLPDDILRTCNFDGSNPGSGNGAGDGSGNDGSNGNGGSGDNDGGGSSGDDGGTNNGGGEGGNADGGNGGTSSGVSGDSPNDGSNPGSSNGAGDGAGPSSSSRASCLSLILSFLLFFSITS